MNDNFKAVDDKHNKQSGFDDIIIGRNCINEALRSGRQIDRIIISNGEHNGAIGPIISKCRKLGIPIKEVSPVKLDSMCSGANHQGIIAIAAAAEYSELDDIFSLAQKRQEPPFIIIADELNDPHNLGAIIRTAEAAGAHGIIIPKRRAVGLTYAVSKAAAGALEYVPVVRIANIASCIDTLKKRGLWIYAADMGGTMWTKADLTGSIALVIGSEGYGVGRLIKEKCDGILSLPMKGHINSLNASVAAGILMYEISRQRMENNK